MTKKYIELNDDLISKLTENKIEFEEIEIEENENKNLDIDSKLKEIDDKYTKIINEKDNVIKSFSDLVNTKTFVSEKPKVKYQSNYTKNLLGGKKINEN